MDRGFCTTGNTQLQRTLPLSPALSHAILWLVLLNNISGHLHSLYGQLDPSVVTHTHLWSVRHPLWSVTHLLWSVTHLYGQLYTFCNQLHTFCGQLPTFFGQLQTSVVSYKPLWSDTLLCGQIHFFVVSYTPSVGVSLTHLCGQLDTLNGHLHTLWGHLFVCVVCVYWRGEQVLRGTHSSMVMSLYFFRLSPSPPCTVTRLGM